MKGLFPPNRERAGNQTCESLIRPAHCSHSERAIRMCCTFRGNLSQAQKIHREVRKCAATVTVQWAARDEGAGGESGVSSPHGIKQLAEPQLGALDH